MLYVIVLSLPDCCDMVAYLEYALRVNELISSFGLRVPPKYFVGPGNTGGSRKISLLVIGGRDLGRVLKGFGADGNAWKQDRKLFFFLAVDSQPSAVFL